jgi:hypothetical protein
MRFKEILHESQNNIVNDLVKDMKSGDINNKVTQAVINYVAKKTNGTPDPDDDPVPAPKEPAAKSDTTTAAQPIAPVAPAAASNPADDDLEPVKEAKAPAKAVADPTLQPDDLAKLLLQGGFKTTEINDIVTFAYKQTIVENCKILAAKKYYTTEAAEILSNMFLSIPGTFRQRTHLSKVLITTGVLDLKKLLIPGSKGTLTDLILPKYRGDAGVIALKNKLKNLSSLPTQISAATKGAGEDLITILGSPVQKLSPGDLNIEGRELEVKAQGARLKGYAGPEVFGNTLPIYNQWASLLTEALGNDGIAALASYGFNLGKYFNFGLNNLEALRQSINASKVKNKGELVHKAFTLFFETLYVQSTTASREMIMRSFDKNGNFEPKTLRQNWLLFSYEYYVQSNKNKEKGTQLHAVMFYHQWDETYFIVTDAKQIAKNIDQFEIGSDLYNWKNPNNQVPKVTFGKEVRKKSERSKETAKAKLAAKKAVK